MHFKSAALILALSSCLAIAAPGFKRAPDGPQGIDVSRDDSDVDWKSAKASGVEFAYIEATNGVDNNTEFMRQYDESQDANIISGGYHIAQPSQSEGAYQADYLFEQAGVGKSLPGALCLHLAHEGNSCHNLSEAAMISWIKDFVDAYKALSDRYPIIYTSSAWWYRCTGNSNAFGASPLWLDTSMGDDTVQPSGWSSYTFLRYANGTQNPGGQDVFQGDSAELAKLV